MSGTYRPGQKMMSVIDKFRGKFKEVPFGTGCVDFDGCLRTLKRLNYNGSFVIEMWSETSADPIGEIEQAKAFLLPKLKEVGYLDQSASIDERASLSSQ